MQQSWPYVFCLLLIGAVGLYVGYMSRSQEVSLLKELQSCTSHVIEKHVVLVVPSKETRTIDDPTLKEVELVQADKNNMKQIAHVQVPQETIESGVSKSSRYADAYSKDLQHTSAILQAINDRNKAERIRARLALAELSIAGPLSKYVESFAMRLLVRFCDDDGKLVHTDYDEYVVEDINNAVALLEKELEEDSSDWVTVSCVDFTPFQRRVQRHAYNGMLRRSLSV